MKLDPTNQLREWLGDEKYTKGSKLPSERALAEELGITRPLLRKALSKLEAENLIWRHIGKGTFVGSRPIEEQDFSNGVAQVTSPSEVMEVQYLQQIFLILKNGMVLFIIQLRHLQKMNY